MAPESNVGPPNVLPHHLAELRKSGLTDDSIREAGIHSETSHDRLAAILNWRKMPKRMVPAMVFPFRGQDGANGYYRAKPDAPRVLSGKQVKYESPIGRANEIYLPPGVAEVITRNGAGLCITEGEKKSLCATQYGFPCVGLVGVYGWKDKKGERLLPSLARIEWAKRPIFIVFDSDIVDNSQVAEAESRLAKMLLDQGAIVKVVRLPPTKDARGETLKVGLDDYLVANGAAAFHELLKAATPPAPVSPSARMKASSEDIDPGDVARGILDRELCGTVPKLRLWRDGWLYWRDGAYRELGNGEVRARVVRWLDERYMMLRQSDSSNVLDVLKAHAILSAGTEPPAWLGKAPVAWPAADVLATRSALVHMPSLVSGATQFTIPATPQYFTTAALDYDFAADAPEPTAWLTFLAELWGDDAESICGLQEWFGYCLTPDTSQQKILMLIGPPRSGKGTVARVLGRLIGPLNVAGPTLASLETNFGLAPLLGKSLAIVADARLSGRIDQSKIVERLLSISGEDSLTIDRKFREGVTAKIGARLMIVSNELPRLAESSGALANRMIVLQLTRSFLGREDTALTNKLLTELPGILLWSIAGWQRLRERGRFLQPASGTEMLDEMRDLSSPIGTFVRERCCVGPEYCTPVENVFRAWSDWCNAVGRDHCGTLQTFGRDLRAAVPSLRTTRPSEGGERYRAFQGVGLIH